MQRMAMAAVHVVVLVEWLVFDPQADHILPKQIK